MFADISGLIGLVIFVAIAIISSLLKRKGEDEFELPPELKPRRDKPPRPQQPVARNWEEQLRRLLEERTAPPPIIEEAPVPPTPVHPVFRPSLVEEAEPHIEVSLHTPSPSVEPTFQRLPGLTQSEARYNDAATLQERVSQHLADVTRHRVGSTFAHRTETPARVHELLESIRRPEGVRRAMLASFILGPPRAFGD